MKQTLLAINDALSEIPGLFVDKNRGQLLIQPSPVKYPCALLDFGSIQYEQQGGLCQIATAEINIDVCATSIRRSSSNAYTESRESSYGIFDTIDAIHQCLQGLQTSHFSRLIRIAMEHLVSDFGYDAYRLVYRTTFLEAKEYRYRYVCAAPDVIINPPQTPDTSDSGEPGNSPDAPIFPAG